jgi:hypothetical protein
MIMTVILGATLLFVVMLVFVGIIIFAVFGLTSQDDFAGRGEMGKSRNSMSKSIEKDILSRPPEKRDDFDNELLEKIRKTGSIF